jgi:PAS domain-containing protein
VHRTAIDKEHLAGVCGIALDALSRPLLVCDREKILYANLAAVRLLSAESVQDLVGLPLDELVHPDMHTPGGIRRQVLTESRQQLLALPAKVFRRDGSVATALVDARPIEFEGQVAIVYSCTPSHRGPHS